MTYGMTLNLCIASETGLMGFAFVEPKMFRLVLWTFVQQWEREYKLCF